LADKQKKSQKQLLKSVLPQIWELVRPRRFHLAMGLVLLLINRFSGLVVPYASKLLLDRVIARHDLRFLLPLAACMTLATVTQGATTYTLSRLLSKEGQKAIAELRRKVQAHLCGLPVSYYDVNKAGGLVSRVMNDVEGVRNLIGTGFVELLGGILTASFVLVIMVHINLLLTVVASGFWLAYSFVLKRTFQTMRPVFQERGRINAEVVGRLTESFSGIRVVKGYHAEEREQGVFARGVEKLLNNSLQGVTAMSLLGTASILNTGLLGTVVMVIGALQVFANKMTPGDLLSYIMFMAYVAAPIAQMTNIGTQITEAVAGLDRVRDILNRQREDEDPERTRTMPGIRGHIRFESVDFEYEAGKPVLEGVSFEAQPGSVTALVGSSGSGKTTIVGLVAAFYKPTQGAVMVDDINLDQVSLSSYRPTLGMVLQETFLFDGTIRENVSFSRPGATEEEIMDACRVAHVDEFVQRFKEKYDTVVGERGVKLSGGQRQRLSIARAVLAQPEILILDEATSSLDSESEAFIQEGLKHLMKGRTTFVIAHRLSTIRQADQILVVESGKIVERGTHQSLYGQKGRYFDLYTRQHGLESNLLRDPELEGQLS
jgi:ABC-type multidrug transport system fused ATPase/permease subunit